MFRKDEYVNYGVYGICRVDDIQKMKFDPGGERDYYVLKPVHQHDASVFVPVGNARLEEKMRPVMSREEIDSLLESIRTEQLPWDSDRKARTAQFRSILLRRDERELMLLAACLYRRSLEEKKGLSTGDAQMLKAAEDIIAREFSFALHMDAQQVGGYIREKLQIDLPQSGE